MPPHQFLNCQECPSRLLGVFCQMTEPLLGELDRSKTTNHYKKKQVVFYEGNQPYGLYCIYSGVVKLYKTGLEGKEQIVRLAKAGDVLGYRSLFSGEPYSATAEILEDAAICFIDQNSLLPLLSRDPKTMMSVIRKLSKELGRAEEQVVGLVQKSAKERLAELLLLLKKGYGKKDPKGILIDLRLTREEISDLIGTTPETAIRILSDMEKEKILLLKGRDIVILNAGALADIAGLIV